MPHFDDATLMAYANGELPAQDAARIAKALADDPHLAARVQRFRNVRTALRKVYDSVASEPVPERLRALLGDVASSEPPMPMATAPSRRVRWLSAPVLAALAAVLIAGVIAGRLLAPAPLIVGESGQLRAGPALDRALSMVLAEDASNEGRIRVGVSFRSKSGAFCRTFMHNEIGGGVSGIACRTAEGWAIPLAASDSASIPRDPSIAGPAVMAMVDTMIDGAPLTGAQEVQARTRNWR